ncbi:MAG: hypothetical protein AAGA34_05455 [Pseudomonadota bacterium]
MILVRGLLLASLVSVAGCDEANPIPMSAWIACHSESGDQLILGHLDLVKERGRFRLQFFEQDVFYEVDELSINGAKARGTARFEGSQTGETKASPFEFSYEFDSRELEVNGASHNCDQLQDRSLITQPIIDED